MKIVNDQTVLVPPGKYFLGDPCYAGIPNEDWQTMGEETNYFNIPVGHVQGLPVLGFHTTGGDGACPGSDGNIYGVDSGCLGLVPAALVTKNITSNEGGRFIEFDDEIVCYVAGADLVFGPVTIDTNYYDENVNALDFNCPGEYEYG